MERDDGLAMFVLFPLSLEYPLRILIASRYKKGSGKKKNSLKSWKGSELMREKRENKK